ncbi:MAG: hypothetical protein AAGA09_00735 [Pseudomonadota bacterium]
MAETRTEAYRQSYREEGYCLIKSLFSPAVSARLVADVGEDIHRVGVDKFLGQTSIHSHPGIEIYSHHYKMLNTLQWGVTALMRDITGVATLEPSFGYFQIYGAGNRLYVHSDRASCEHSMSVTLAYSDGEPWDLVVSKSLVDHSLPEEGKKVGETFDGEDYHRASMAPGDAVAYPGHDRRHGRLEPNPNRWSAHIFLHWVDGAGENAGLAFDGKDRDTAIDFNIPRA